CPASSDITSTSSPRASCSATACTSVPRFAARSRSAYGACFSAETIASRPIERIAYTSSRWSATYSATVLIPHASSAFFRSPLPISVVTPSTLFPSSLRSEEHTSELQSRENLVCRLLLEKKKHLTPPL